MLADHECSIDHSRQTLHALGTPCTDKSDCYPCLCNQAMSTHQKTVAPAHLHQAAGQADIRWVNDIQAGAQNAEELPDKFRVAPTTGGSRSPHLILLHREVAMDAWVFDNNVSSCPLAPPVNVPCAGSHYIGISHKGCLLAKSQSAWCCSSLCLAFGIDRADLDF